MTTADEEKAFLREILAVPEDDTVRLAYADWLQENGREVEARRHRARADVTSGVRTVARAVRGYVISQLSLWQQVPYWALQANGRTGWNDRCTQTVRHGYWSVDGGPGEYKLITVDCETSELGHYYYDAQCDRETWHPGGDAEVVRAGLYVDKLDAGSVVADMRAHVEKYQDPPSFYTAEQWAEAELGRQKTLARGHITPTSYRRVFA